MSTEDASTRHARDSGWIWGSKVATYMITLICVVLHGMKNGTAVYEMTVPCASYIFRAGGGKRAAVFMCLRLGRGMSPPAPPL